MSIDLEALHRAVARHGRVARVVVAETSGSVPREVGAAMLVWREGAALRQSGTIGGGALELKAAETAFSQDGAMRYPLGPGLGQCCGGAVTLWTDWIDADWLHRLGGQEVVARGPGAPPLRVARHLDHARARGERPAAQLLDGWMLEPVHRADTELWVWGAGHVGRALVSTLAPLPEVALIWADTHETRFPTEIPPGVTPVWAAVLPRLAASAPAHATHLVVTYSHDIDLALCHALLTRGFGWCGLIGSDTKWARFRKRLMALGHGADHVARITCPIGKKELGKHPQAIAIGVAAELLCQRTAESTAWPTSSWASQA